MEALPGIKPLIKAFNKYTATERKLGVIFTRDRANYEPSAFQRSRKESRNRAQKADASKGGVKRASQSNTRSLFRVKGPETGCQESKLHDWQRTTWIHELVS